jgi:ABC-type nitrate/sulfonate/bicarbonate transport system substrate-binding protein
MTLFLNKIFKISSILFCCISNFCYATESSNFKQKKSVTLLLDWKPNTNHLGFYVAKDKGFYQEEGLELNIINPTQSSTVALVAVGKADFGIGYANQFIYAQNKNIPLVSVAGIIYKDTSCFVWRSSLDIKTIKDLEGKRYGGWGSPEEHATLKYIFEKNNASFDKLKMLTIGTLDFLPATLKTVDFTWEYPAWNILAAQLKKVSVQTYCPAEHFPELNKPSPLIFTSQHLIKQDPKRIKQFMRATAKGYQFAIQNPNEAAKIFIKSVPEMDSDLVYASAKMLSPLFQAQGKKWGEQNVTEFVTYANWMKKSKLIQKIPDFNSSISNSFLP